MIKSITVTNYLGETLEMELARPEKSGFVVRKIEGLGPVRANINTKEIATMDGSMYNSAKVGQRNIVLYLDFIHATSIEDIRLKSYRYFPVKKPITLLVTTDNRIAEITGYVESNDPDIFSRTEGAQISIICPNPYFQSAGAYGYNTTVFSGLVPLFEFPFSNESVSDDLIEFGDIRQQSFQNVYYEGDTEVGVVITINVIGDASNISIYNTQTREIMRLKTESISGLKAGDEIIISTVDGDKSILLLREGVGYNILNCLDRNSDWLRLIHGNNVFAYVAESGMTNIQLKIENRVLYEGV